MAGSFKQSKWANEYWGDFLSGFANDDVVKVQYKEKYRIGRISKIVSFSKIEVEFFDNGEKRRYNISERRVSLATPVDIVRWRNGKQQSERE